MCGFSSGSMDCCSEEADQLRTTLTSTPRPCSKHLRVSPTWPTQGLKGRTKTVWRQGKFPTGLQNNTKHLFRSSLESETVPGTPFWGSQALPDGHQRGWLQGTSAVGCACLKKPSGAPRRGPRAAATSIAHHNHCLCMLAAELRNLMVEKLSK